MVHSAHLLAIVASFVALELGNSVNAVPLPVSRTAFATDSSDPPILAIKIGYPMLPSSVQNIRTTIRGSTRASQQAAKAKRSLTRKSQALDHDLQSGGSSLPQKAMHLASVPSDGWVSKN